MTKLVVRPPFEVAVNNVITGKVPNTKFLDVILYNKKLTERKLKEITNDDKSELEEIDRVIGEWAYSLGVEIMAEDIIIINNHIRDHFPLLNIFDLRLLVKMVAADSDHLIDGDAKYQAKMSLIYISKTIKMYQKYRNDITFDVRSKVQKFNNRLELPVSKEAQVESMQKLISFEYKNRKEGQFVFDWGNVIFRFIKHNKLVNLSLSENPLIEEALAHGERNFKLDIKEANKGKFTNLVKESDYSEADKKSIIERHAMRYVVNNWLETIDLDKTLKSLTAEMLAY